MESCSSWNYTGFGSGASEYLGKIEFVEARKQILSLTASLKTKTSKNEFRDGCLKLADYLIKIKDKPPDYTNPKRWVPVLRNYFGHKFKELSQHGGCPMIFEQKDRDLLELKYDALDFCEINKSYQKKLNAFKKRGSSTYNCNSDAKCISECTEYSTWFISKKKYFEGKKGLTSESCIFKNTSSQFPEKTCNILNPKTFSKPPQCLLPEPVIPSQPPPKEKDLSPPNVYQIKSEDLPATQEQSTFQGKLPTDTGSDNSPDIASGRSPNRASENPPQLQTASEDNSEARLTNLTEDTQHRHPEIINVPVFSTPEQKTTQDSVYQPPVDQDLNTEGNIKTKSLANEASIPKTFLSTPVDPKVQGPVVNSHSPYISSFLITFLIIIVSFLFIKYVLMGKFKKKKNIRRQVKFLKILLPSNSVKKDIFLSNDHLDQPIHDDEEIIKKLKIHEHNTIKNTNMPKRKKDRSKTIIEVHMKVLEEFRNEQWALSKKEFLAICLEVYANEEYRSHPNLIKYDKVENIKYSTDTKEKGILWNKWIEKHRNISKKLEKADWFNHLKNEWKKEMEELSKKYSNENENVSFLEREKVIWRQWISNKGKIVEQNMEQDWFKGLTDEFNNILGEYENEETKSSVSLINIEELAHNKSCEELYKYIKKKLLAKLCILVFMTILEECKKEQSVENKELYLDISINESITRENSDRKPEIAEETVGVKGDILEYRLNDEIPSYKGMGCFMKELQDWIKEDNKN
ncbi:STP1 protein [Plasmodium malariae]|uniref:STP1 protein n=1 Tax=Plasmodium malariae TaxID=5858 RepID=A0A1D3RHC3_PLAMA|nr:STP1 protein [Plasmodium malariae]SCN44540.1 STP1 protein [Plasmodium malariae]